LDWTAPPKRSRGSRHERFCGLTGRLTGRVTALTPLFLPDKRVTGNPKQFIRNEARQAIIPGSSLKGLIRSVVETVGPGCWWLFDGTYEGRRVDYQERLPQEFRRCRNLDSLCPACRMFGMLAGRASLLGKVCFNEAVCVKEERHEAVFTPILDGPKPRHGAWYLRQDKVAGRKFYFHQPGIQTLRELRQTNRGVAMNQHIAPLGQGTVFEFSVNFYNVEEKEEWPLLLYALCLEPGVRHKFGYAKPAGFGSIEIELTALHLTDPVSRYGGGKTSRNVTGKELDSLVTTAIQDRTTDKQSVTLCDLRRIWAWPPHDNVKYGYPGQAWFRDNPKRPIAETSEV
ncbi:MAG: RAMP superfamily CRISPR-associated protein, partial [Candidatus Eremiobacterota bacterium]